MGGGGGDTYRGWRMRGGRGVDLKGEVEKRTLSQRRKVIY